MRQEWPQKDEVQQGKTQVLLLQDQKGQVLYGALSCRGKLPQLPGGSGCGKEQVSSEMIQVLQGNMNRTREAGALLEQITREEDSNILLLSEQSYKMNHKY